MDSKSEKSQSDTPSDSEEEAAAIAACDSSSSDGGADDAVRRQKRLQSLSKLRECITGLGMGLPLVVLDAKGDVAEPAEAAMNTLLSPAATSNKASWLADTVLSPNQATGQETRPPASDSQTATTTSSSDASETSVTSKESSGDEKDTTTAVAGETSVPEAAVFCHGCNRWHCKDDPTHNPLTVAECAHIADAVNTVHKVVVHGDYVFFKSTDGRIHRLQCVPGMAVSYGGWEEALSQEALLQEVEFPQGVYATAAPPNWVDGTTVVCHYLGAASAAHLLEAKLATEDGGNTPRADGLSLSRIAIPPPELRALFSWDGCPSTNLFPHIPTTQGLRHIARVHGLDAGKKVLSLLPNEKEFRVNPCCAAAQATPTMGLPSVSVSKWDKFTLVPRDGVPLGTTTSDGAFKHMLSLQQTASVSVHVDSDAAADKATVTSPLPLMVASALISSGSFKKRPAHIVAAKEVASGGDATESIIIANPETNPELYSRTPGGITTAELDSDLPLSLRQKLPEAWNHAFDSGVWVPEQAQWEAEFKERRADSAQYTRYLRNIPLSNLWVVTTTAPDPVTRVAEGVETGATDPEVTNTPLDVPTRHYLVKYGLVVPVAVFEEILVTVSHGMSLWEAQCACLRLVLYGMIKLSPSTLTCIFWQWEATGLVSMEKFGCVYKFIVAWVKQAGGVEETTPWETAADVQVVQEAFVRQHKTQGRRVARRETVAGTPVDATQPGEDVDGADSTILQRLAALGVRGGNGWKMSVYPEVAQAPPQQMDCRENVVVEADADGAGNAAGADDVGGVHAGDVGAGDVGAGAEADSDAAAAAAGEAADFEEGSTVVELLRQLTRDVSSIKHHLERVFPLPKKSRKT